MKKLVAFPMMILLLIAAVSFSPVQKGEWTKLGSRTVDLAGDHDEIKVGVFDGTFTKVRFKVMKAPIHVASVKIVFGNGESKKVKIDKNFKVGTFSKVIDLPGNKRVIKKVVMNNPATNCIIKGKKSDWDGLPKNKSLFHSPKGCGLPIGNLTSQVFANFYMDKFDHYIKHNLGIRYYGRYVDDFVVVLLNKAWSQHSHVFGKNQIVRLILVNHFKHLLLMFFTV